MKKIFFLLFLLSVCALNALAQNDVGKFRYQPEKIKVGAVYHYVKTNIDGTPPAENISVYIASKEKIEVFKSRTKGERAALVIAEMDWKMFSVKRLESWQAFPGGERKLFATLDCSEKEKAVDVSIPTLKKEIEKVSIPLFPFHVYNFDLSSLNFAFPHLKNPKASFTIGITDPTFKADGPMFEYRGAVTVSYVGEEVRDGVLCRKYKIDGEGLANRGGFIWVDKKGEFFRDVEIGLADNPDWKTFKFKLKKAEKLSREKWEVFMKELL